MFQNHFLRFMIVGVVNTCIGFSIMFICLSLFHLGYWVSSATGNSIGAVISYFLNRRYIFNSNVRVGIGFIRFSIVILICYFFSYKIGIDLVGFTLNKYQISGQYVEGIALLFGSGLYTVSNYIGQRYFVFQKRVIKEV